MRKLLVLVGLAMAVGAGGASAATANSTQKGSLLIFPDIDVRTPVQTIVRIQNDGARDVWVKCFYLDGYKHRTDFQFKITAGQPFWFDVRTGDGTDHVTPYPNTPSNGFPNRPTPLGAGMLACWVVNQIASNQLRFNNLAGTATVIDHGNGGAYEYNAYAFAAPYGTNMSPVGYGGEIQLNGINYDACPASLMGQFSPTGTVLPGPAPVTFGNTRIAFTGCTIDLRDAWQPTWTRLAFDVWNEDEDKITGAWECADTWHELFLVSNTAAPNWPFPTADAGSSNFSIDTLGTPVGRYRVQARAGSECRPLVGADTVAVGLLGIQSTDIAIGGGIAGIGTNLATLGQFNGVIRWDATYP